VASGTSSSRKPPRAAKAEREAFSLTRIHKHCTYINTARMNAEWRPEQSGRRSWCAFYFVADGVADAEAELDADAEADADADALALAEAEALRDALADGLGEALGVAVFGL
jgi:hypothetical protein